LQYLGRLNGPGWAADLLQRLAQEQGMIPRAQGEAALPTA
jgi:hypothetical protein